MYSLADGTMKEILLPEDASNNELYAPSFQPPSTP
jgi:hypothetical protein